MVNILIFILIKRIRKPENILYKGTTYQWYEMDERLNKPEDLKVLHLCMLPERQYLDVNSY